MPKVTGEISLGRRRPAYVVIVVPIYEKVQKALRTHSVLSTRDSLVDRGKLPFT